MILDFEFALCHCKIDQFFQEAAYNIETERRVVKSPNESSLPILHNEIRTKHLCKGFIFHDLSFIITFHSSTRVNQQLCFCETLILFSFLMVELHSSDSRLTWAEVPERFRAEQRCFRSLTFFNTDSEKN